MHLYNITPPPPPEKKCLLLSILFLFFFKTLVLITPRKFHDTSVFNLRCFFFFFKQGQYQRDKFFENIDFDVCVCTFCFIYICVRIDFVDVREFVV